MVVSGQWRNRWGGGRGQSAPETSDREIFADVSGKKRQGKKGKGWKLRRKEGNCKMKGEKFEMEVVKIIKSGEDFFFLFFFSFSFFFFFFCFSLLKTTEICFRLPKWKFSTGKNILRREKIRKNDFAPSEKYACYAPNGSISFKQLFCLGGKQIDCSKLM